MSNGSGSRQCLTDSKLWNLVTESVHGYGSWIRQSLRVPRHDTTSTMFLFDGRLIRGERRAVPQDSRAKVLEYQLIVT